MAVIITERDVNVMSFCADAQWLTTAQIRRCFFPAACALRTATRLRELRSARFLHSDFGCIGTPFPIRFHTLGPAGRSVLLSRGRSRASIRLRRAVPSHLAHLAGVNDIRIAVATCPCKVNHFFAHWQLTPQLWPHDVSPDAGFSLDAPRRLTVLAEFERGTEVRSVLDTKLDAYAALRCSVSFTALLFVVEQPGMVQRLVAQFRHRASFPVLVGTLGGILSAGILSHRFVDVSTSASTTLAGLS